MKHIILTVGAVTDFGDGYKRVEIRADIADDDYNGKSSLVGSITLHSREGMTDKFPIGATFSLVENTEAIAGG